MKTPKLSVWMHILIGIIIGFIFMLAINYIYTYDYVCMESEHFTRLLQRAGYL